MAQRGKTDFAFLFKKSAIALTVKSGGMIGQYLFLFTVARYLGPGSLGAFTISFSVMQLIAVFALLGLDNLLIRKVAAAKAENDADALRNAYFTSFSITTLSSLLLAGVFFFMAPFLSVSVFDKPALTEHFRMISYALPFFVFTTIHAAGFRGAKHMMGFTLFKTLVPLLNCLVIVMSWYLNLSVTPVSAFTFSVVLLAAGYAIAWWKFNGFFRSTTGFVSQNWKDTLHHSLPMMITGSIFFVLNWVDNLVIGIFWPEADVGFYDAAFKISSVSAAVLMAINAIQAPLFAEFHSLNEQQKLKAVVFRSTRLLFYASFPITLFLIVFPDWILSFFGGDFSRAALSLQILSFGNFVNCITGSVGILLMMTGHQRIYNTIVMIAAVISILLNFILVPRFGIEGAAIASSFSKILWNVGALWVVYKKLNITSVFIPGFSKSPEDM